MQFPEKLSEQSVVQMCANNMDPLIAKCTGTTKPNSFDAHISKVRNVEKQFHRQKSAQLKREESKRPTKIGESMATTIKTSPNPTNGKMFNKNSKGKEKEEG